MRFCKLLSVSALLLSVAGCTTSKLVTSATQAPNAHEHFPNQIDAISSAADITRFIHQLDASYPVTDSLRFADERYANEIAKTSAKAWYKADFDGNGYTDLLALGASGAGERQVICVLDSGSNRFHIAPFHRRPSGRSCAIPLVVYDGVWPLVKYTDFETSPSENEPLKNKQEYLLSYQFGNFVEYTRKQYHYQIKQIEFSASATHPEASTLNMLIDKDREATYSSTEAPIPASATPKTEHLTATLDPHTYDEIVSLLIYLDFPHLRASYGSVGNHVPHSTLIIKYNHGRRKVIEDDGAAGTFGLSQVYALLLRLRATQAWQPSTQE